MINKIDPNAVAALIATRIREVEAVIEAQIKSGYLEKFGLDLPINVKVSCDEEPDFNDKCRLCEKKLVASQEEIEEFQGLCLDCYGKKEQECIGEVDEKYDVEY